MMYKFTNIRVRNQREIRNNISVTDILDNTLLLQEEFHILLDMMHQLCQQIRSVLEQALDQEYQFYRTLQE